MSTHKPITNRPNRLAAQAITHVQPNRQQQRWVYPPKRLVQFSAVLVCKHGLGKAASKWRRYEPNVRVECRFHHRNQLYLQLVDTKESEAGATECSRVYRFDGPRSFSWWTFGLRRPRQRVFLRHDRRRPGTSSVANTTAATIATTVAAIPARSALHVCHCKWGRCLRACGTGDPRCFA
jgi:hypothetical protein